MNTTRCRRLAVTALLTAALASMPGVAWGHATFTSPATVPADADAQLTLDVPEERGDDVHNAKVIVEVPEGFTVTGCQTKPEWECGGSPSGGETVVTWTRTAGSNPDAAFSFGVRTPSKAGRYTFEVNQFYGDGEAVRWDGPSNSDYPAPVLEVR